MDSQEQKEYRALVRGAATYILLGDKNPPTNALELVRIYNLDPAIMNADTGVLRESWRSQQGVPQWPPGSLKELK
ncbi:MAG: hypothetical protein M1132_06520 [Chloroflexi bacterium]|nr:hypothetical protein [Chloroflexota bacterium]